MVFLTQNSTQPVLALSVETYLLNFETESGSLAIAG